MNKLIFILCFISLTVVVLKAEVVLTDPSYVRVEGGVYSKLTVSIEEGVPQPKHCQTFLDNLEVRIYLHTPCSFDIRLYWAVKMLIFLLPRQK